MADSDTATNETVSRSRSKTSFHIVESKEPAYSVSPRNPAGDILTVRVPLVVTQKADGTLDAATTAKDTYDLFKALVEQVVGAVWADSPEVYLASFDPAVAQAMTEGASLEDALDVKDPDKRQVAAYERLKVVNRGSFGGGGGGGSRSGGGGGGGTENLVNVMELAGSDYEALPKAFRDELSKGAYCPSCGSEKFWDNRGSDRGGPKFSCANKDCTGGGKKQNGGNFPWGWFGSQQGQGGGGGGGQGRKRGRGD